MANLKRNTIELVKEVKEGEVVTERYLTPVFLPLDVVYEAVDLAEEVDSGKMSQREMMEKLISFVSNKVYGKQFTQEELKNGLHGPQAIDTLIAQLRFAANGVQDDETKKFLAKKR